MEENILEPWLPEDERLLLRIYYGKMQELRLKDEAAFNETQKYDVDDLADQFVYIKEHSKIVDLDRRFHLRRHIKNLSMNLEEHKLITLSVFKASDLPSVDKYIATQIRVSFTRDGYKLAGQYSSFWQRLRLRYNAYIKGHPVIVALLLIIAYILGILSEVIIDWITKEPAQ